MRKENCSSCQHCKLEINFETEKVTRGCNLTSKTVGMYDFCNRYRGKVISLGIEHICNAHALMGSCITHKVGGEY